MSTNWSQPPSGSQPGGNDTKRAPLQIPPHQRVFSSARQAGQDMFGNAAQMVRTVSGKMVAISRQNIAPPPAPLVRYHPPIIKTPEPRPKARRWRRSVAVRIAGRIRHRRGRTQGGGTRIALALVIALLVLLVISGSSATSYGYAYYQSQQPQLQGIANQQISQVTHIYDRNGLLLADVTDNINGAGRRMYVPYDQIPPVMDIAQMAAEDPTFMTNGGIDPQGLFRAALNLGTAGGGSTITQQLIKMMRKQDAPTWDRKLSEGALAIGLTQQYSKEKILEMYLNIAPYGILKLGVEDAAQEYFGLTRQCDKNFKCTSAVSQLDYDPIKKTHSALLALARASLLASIPQDPTNFDLTLWQTSTTLKAKVLYRQDYVLKQMVGMGEPIKGIGPNGKDGPVTAAIIQQVETMSAAMTFTDHRPGVRAPHFVNWVVSQLAGILGNGNTPAARAIGAQMLENGGFNIRTSIDANLETYVENSVKRHLTQPEDQLFPYPEHISILQQDNNVNDAAVVVMNAKTGEILAMDGSLDYYNTKNAAVGGQVNVAVSPRLPGSTFKPIVYATTFEMGWTPGTVLPDYQTYFANGTNPGSTIKTDGVYSPPDYSGWTKQPTPIRLATAESLNVPAVKAVSFAGLDNVVTTAERMGITSIANQAAGCKAEGKTMTDCFHTAMVLGTASVTLTEMVDAYQTFANQGVHVASQSILDIWDNAGHNLYHFDPTHPQGARVFTSQVAYMMTSVLADEASRQGEFLGDHDLSFYDWPEAGCDGGAQKPLPDCTNHQVAAKTGTTDLLIDNWTIGYTPDVVVGVWAGNANGDNPMQRVAGISGAAPIWHGVMERVSGRACVGGVDQYGVACGNFNPKSLNFHDNLFTKPDGIHAACLSPINGLMAPAGSACTNYDWVLDGQDPTQTGILQPPASTTNKNGGNGDNNGGNGG